MTINTPGGGNMPTVIPGWVILAGLLAMVAVVVGALIYIPADNTGEARIGLILTIVGPVILLLTNLLRQEFGVKVSQDTKTDTEHLLNGGLQQKIDAGVNRALVQHVVVTHRADPPPPDVPPGT